MIIVIALLALLVIEAPAQILWEHKTSSLWGYNPDTGEEDSAYCFTALSCYGNNCTAAGRAQRKLGVPNHIIYRSNDAGRTWFAQNANVSLHWTFPNGGFRKLQQIDSLNVVAMAWEEGTIIRTTDAGTSWFNINCPAKRDLWDIHFSDPMTGILVCAGADSTLFTTTDGGLHWNYHPSSAKASCHSYGNGKFCVFQYGHGPFYFTTDNFASIDSTPQIFDSNTDPEYDYVLAYIEYGPGDTIYAMGNYYGDDSSGSWHPHGLIIRSTDGGKSWEEPWIFPWMKMAYIKHITSVDRDTIFAGGGDHRHYIYSLDRGKTWLLDSILIDTIHETGRCFGMEISPDGRPIAAFGSPVFAHESTLTRGEFISLKVEDEVGITGLIKYRTYFFPNPTAGVVNIESIDRSRSPVTVFDVFGREVLKGEKLSAEGKLSLDLSHLPHGIYNIVFNFLGRKFIVGKVSLVE